MRILRRGPVCVIRMVFVVDGIVSGFTLLSVKILEEASIIIRPETLDSWKILLDWIPLWILPGSNPRELIYYNGRELWPIRRAEGGPLPPAHTQVTLQEFMVSNAKRKLRQRDSNSYIFFINALLIFFPLITLRSESDSKRGKRVLRFSHLIFPNASHPCPKVGWWEEWQWWLLEV